MSFYRRYLFHSLAWSFAALIVVGGGVQLRASRAGTGLKVEWDGFGGRFNFRDVGTSLNACLVAAGAPRLLKEGRLGRSNHKFSGFSCGRVGKPEVIYSLNFNPTSPGEYFCVSDQGPVVGRHFNEKVVLNDLEFLKTWEDPNMRTEACGFFRDSFSEISQGRKVLVHCEAGRDRTGTYAALLQALVAESSGRLDQTMLSAIECDYRATPSLKPYKYGRMASFVEELMHTGGVAGFLSSKCGVEPEIIRQVAQSMKWEGAL